MTRKITLFVNGKDYKLQFFFFTIKVDFWYRVRKSRKTVASYPPSIVGSTRKDLLNRWTQQDGVLVLNCVATLDIA